MSQSRETPNRFTIAPFVWSRSKATRGSHQYGHPDKYAEPVEGARIIDWRTGLTYEATVEGGRLASLTIVGTEGGALDRDALRRIPVAMIAEQVVLHLAATNEEILRTGDLLADVHADGLHAAPPLEVIAAEVMNGITIKAQAKLHNLSTAKVNRLRREARTAGLIPEATTGRGHAQTRQTNRSVATREGDRQ